MSTNSHFTTFCDSDLVDGFPKYMGCPGWTGEADSKADSRKIAKANGWALGKGDLPDLCPICTPRGWCPDCGASGTEHCTTESGRDHRARSRLRHTVRRAG